MDKGYFEISVKIPVYNMDNDCMVLEKAEKVITEEKLWEDSKDSQGNPS